MEIIDSPQNAQVKRFRSLATAKGRREHGLFPVEGIHGVQALIKAGWTPEVGCVCPELLADAELGERLRDSSRDYLELTARAFKALSDTVSPQGIAAVAKMPWTSIKNLPAGPAVFLAVHELRDPGNMGAIIRSVDAAGAAGIIAVGDCVDLFAPKVVRATAGSIFHVTPATCSVEGFLNWARETEATVVATDTSADQACWEVELPERLVLLVGNEAHGLPEQILTASDLQVRIPMPGRAESLNAAVAAGILLYETIRQRY